MASSLDRTVPATEQPVLEIFQNEMNEERFLERFDQPEPKES
jgi:hypothetical protein